MVGAGGGELDHGQAADEVGVVGEMDTGDGEVLHAAEGLDAVVGIGGDFLGPMRSCSVRERGE